MIQYKKYQNTNEESKSYGKWFCRAAHQRVTFEEFIRHMVNHHCVYSEGTIRGVLIEMEECMRELLLEGKAVQFDDLGTFKVGLVNKRGGSPTAAECNARQIEGVRMNLFLGKRFRAKQLFTDARFGEAGIYAGFDEPDEGENAATETPTPTPSTGNGGEDPTDGD